MKYLQSFPLFEAMQPVPSHEELSSLPEWKRMEWCNPQWTTGARAYANGTRSFKTEHHLLGPWGRNEYRIYPQNGTLTDNKYTLLRDLKFDSLEDWNDSLLKINAYLIYKYIGTDRWGRGVGGYGIEIKSRVKIEQALRGIKLRSLEDDIIKILFKEGRDQGIAAKLIPLIYETDLNKISNKINQRVEENPQSISTEVLKSAIKSGLLIPSEFTKTVVNIGDFGFFEG